MWTDNNVNLSVALVEEGLASVHFSAEKSEYYRQLKAAEDTAKAQRKKIWTSYVEEEKTEELHEEKEDKVTERKVSHEKVLVTEISPELKFFAQHTDQGAKLESLMAKLRQDFQVSPPITGAYTPKRKWRSAFSSFIFDLFSSSPKFEKIFNDENIFFRWRLMCGEIF